MRSLAHRVSAWNRERKWSLFIDRCRPTTDDRVLDVGYSANECSPVDNYIEKAFPWPENLTAVGIDEPEAFKSRYPRVAVRQYDGAKMPFADQAFDIVWCNAVLEHVGDFEEQVAFLRELSRVGGTVFGSTPNRWFPIELHTRLPLVHWLPKPLFDRILQALGRSWAAGDYMHLLGRGSLEKALVAAGYDHHTLISNRLGPFVLDYVYLSGNRASE